ncbi:POK9 protein, partial [Furnarius figulus]|nr:POK9 protein [Furnarius figulus]NWR95754.1 POK9 protein [Furnarius figulus]
SGSAGVDLAGSETVVFADSSVKLIPTEVFGPLGEGKSALLLGRSSTTLQGLFVLPGVIDSDYTGQIQIMAWTPRPPCMVVAKSRIAQLIFFDAKPPAAATVYCNMANFGSTGLPQILWPQVVSEERPLLTCRLTAERHSITLTGILDRGADVTVIS